MTESTHLVAGEPCDCKPNRDPEYLAALDRIRLPRVIGPEDFPTEAELRDDLTRAKTGRVER